ncbi:ABC transporter ATP-binding protein [Streptomyces sp. NL15-2K]|uniref:ABC transporter ATP-binding protein n=1 Tax=Streptomyces sp. NL15-2K TaxID=376149 RepID=UPI000F58950C|nr:MULTISPECIES: ABC transporter ATP-binding protein [Actinomycetes]WKX08600.1 ABC transporter ATP-binding protein [Kutzneria buriramensis]GCB50029.1 nucleoside ABC transporter [Streptomyces sp. NL15-2K]
MTPTTSAARILELRGITKSYGSVTACDAVDLTVDAGEIHGLLGENGAGKSSLMKVLLGLIRRDAGTVLVRGEQVALDSPQEAAELGIGMVHQHFSLISGLTVWENVALGDTGTVDKQAICADIAEVAERYRLPVDPEARVDALSAGERQRVEVVKCLRRNPQILILDEPTSVLTQAESEELFAVLGRVVQEEGRAVILISHKLAEIVQATDRVTVLRKGRVAFRAVTAETTAPELARQMVGRDVSLREEGAALGLLPVTTTRTGRGGAHDRPPPVLRLDQLTVEKGGVKVLQGVDLTVGAGEICALYGVEGSGQAALGEVLAGLLAPTAGTVEVAGSPVDLSRPGVLGKAGLGIVPEDRHQSGVVLDMSVTENLTMKSLDRLSGRFLLRRRAMHAEARRLADEFNIVTPSLDAPVRSLSGGNQQRVVLARELSGHTSVLVAAQPTHGLDVGAIEDMYARLRQAAADGVGVLLISTELEEVMALATWIAVISSGRITGALPVSEATPERLGMLVGGEAA